MSVYDLQLNGTLYDFLYFFWIILNVLKLRFVCRLPRSKQNLLFDENNVTYLFITRTDIIGLEQNTAKQVSHEFITPNSRVERNA